VHPGPGGEAVLFRGLKEEFGRMIFEKESSLGHRTKVQSMLPAAARGSDTWRRNVWRPMYIRLLLQFTLTLAYIKALSKTLPNIHGSSHVPAPRQTPTTTCRRRWLNFSTVTQGRFFFKNHPAKFFLRGPWGNSGVRSAQTNKHPQFEIERLSGWRSTFSKNFF